MNLRSPFRFTPAWFLLLLPFAVLGGCTGTTGSGSDAGPGDGVSVDRPSADASNRDTWVPTPFAGCDGEVTFVAAPSLTPDGDGFRIAFELDQATDVEVMIVNPDDGSVVRHLAAGVLGANAPAPLVPNELSQQVHWDGTNDRGEPVPDTSRFVPRVRAGMCTELVQTVGDDPYAFFSSEMPVNNHTMWQMTGLEVKSDGTVFVMGTAGMFGPITVRQYDADGEYMRTVFPFPAGLDIADVEGWGVNTNADGTYTPRHVKSSWPGLSTTALQHSTWQNSPKMFHNPDPSQITVRGSTFGLTTFNADGSIDPDSSVHRRDQFVTTPPLRDPEVHRDEDNIRGPIFTCMTPDGSGFYLSGLYKNGSDFYEDGTIWKVDVESGVATEWFSLGSTVEQVPFSYSTLHGIAVDDSGHVFVADRFNNRILVLDEDAGFVREIPLMNPDDIAYSSTTGALYVSSRVGTDHRPGDVRLHKIADWSTSAEVTEEIFVMDYQFDYLSHNRTRLAVVDSGDQTNIWLVYKDIPVRIYRDSETGLALHRDFYQTGARQRFLGFNRMVVDRQTENVYISGAFTSVFRLNDWSNPQFTRLMIDSETPLMASDVGVDSQQRFLFTKNTELSGGGRVFRFDLDEPMLTPRPVSGATENHVSGYVWYNYYFFSGNSDRGFAVAPNGQVAGLSGVERLDFGSKVLVFPPATADNLGTLEPNIVGDFGTTAGGIRFDLQGNLYVGALMGEPLPTPPGFEGDPVYGRWMGQIRKFAPTGSGDSLFEGPLGEPERVFDTHYGSMYSDGSETGVTPRFAVDEYARLYIPNSMTQSVTIVDNNGTEIIRFGTYGNLDSRGGLAGDQVPTDDIPMAWPVSVDATDDYIYVTDLVNVRLLRIRKHFALDSRNGSPSDSR